MNFYDILAAEKWDGGISTMNFFDLLFAQSISGEQWQVYEGTLPATLNANGADMKQYQIYGATGGVGDDSGTAYGYKMDISTSDGTNTTTTPFYIGDEPLDKDEYVNYTEQKVYRRTAQVMPSAPAEIKTSNGITVTCDGEGRYTISGTANDDVNIVFDIPDFTVPISVGQSGNGTISFFNNYRYSISGGSLLFLRNGETVFAWSFTALNRTNNTYGASIGGKPMNGLKFIVKSGDTVNGITSPMFTDNGILPETYIPYLQPADPPVPLPALPTCEGTTIVDFMGQSVAPEKVLLEYAKGGN